MTGSAPVLRYAEMICIKKHPDQMIGMFAVQAVYWSRTSDLILTKDVLYLLS